MHTYLVASAATTCAAVIIEEMVMGAGLAEVDQQSGSVGPRV
jgi:hypothetical protein